MQTIETHVLDNGLTVALEPMSGVESVSLTLMVPAGMASEPEDRQGLSGLLTEMVCRGAGGLSSRAHVDLLDRLGVVRTTGSTLRHFRLGATLVGDRLSEALGPLLDMAMSPALSEADFEPSRQLALQTLDGLQDDPQHRVMLDLRRVLFPTPLGRSPHGRRADVEASSVEDVRGFWERRCRPGGGVLAIAGKLDPERVLERVSGLVSGWTGRAEPVSISPTAYGGPVQSVEKTSQVHIGVGLEAIPELDEGVWCQRLAVAALSGGMSARLFTEVREKRGLCYSVHASYAGAREFGAIMAYAGTTPERAEQTLDVLSGELVRIHEGLEADEFARAKTGMKARVVMSGESTSARASALASDLMVLGRTRSLEEVGAKIDGVTLEQVNAFLASREAGVQRVVTIGPEPLAVPERCGG
ncbi:M16 family metallopeptidase [Mucisphaera calidilacus]|uniref:Peptidase M16 inactive domain protein n=1 Tax=Mucisphaera calidilacus TaxID=2527982 RepID=A0A518C1B1_9BACT|nr:pitrilysin family protein [Mucisphaera calidilacus]QDU73011.1 Peptidase M16 inactive domain protein [Mucisphaera calidilacus]